MSTTINLPLGLTHERNFQAFFTGLEDDKVRAGLKNQPQTDKSVIQLIDLIEDKTFLGMASSVANQLHSLGKQQQVAPFALAAPTAPQTASAVDKLKQDGQALNDYVKNTYPDAMQLLRSYGEKAYPKMAIQADDTVGANVSVAANAGAVVNAAVWANVAVATQAVVAAAVVAVVGAFVT